MKIIIVNGYPGCGKTTFEQYCIDQFPKRIYAYSTIELPKQIYELCGWNGEKTPADRKFLSELKDFLNTHNDIIWKYTLEYLLEVSEEELFDKEKIVFIDCREPDMIARFKKELRATTVFIKREVLELNELSNSSDRDVEKFKYDIYIDNNGNLDELYNKAYNFCIDILEV